MDSQWQVRIQITASWEANTLSVFLQFFIRKASALLPRCETQDEFLDYFSGQGGWTHGTQEKSVLGIAENLLQDVRGGNKGWKTGDLCDLERYKCGKVLLCVWVWTSNWNKAVAQKACISKSQQEGWLGSKDQLLAERLTHILRGSTLYMCIDYLLTKVLPNFSAREGSRMTPLVVSVFMWVLCLPLCDLCNRYVYVCVRTYICTYVMYMYAPCVCAYWEYISAVLLFGPEDMELQQPGLSQAVRSSMIFSSNSSINFAAVGQVLWA